MRWILLVAACAAAFVILAGSPAIAAEPAPKIAAVPVAPVAPAALGGPAIAGPHFPRLWRVLHPFEGRLQARVAYAVRHGRWLRWAVCGR